MKFNQSVKIGISPIGWTNDDMPELGGEITFEQCISEMFETNYAGCEIGNKFPKDPEILRQKLKEKKLSVCNAWFSTYILSKGIDAVLVAFTKQCIFLAKLGAKVIGVSEQTRSIQQVETPIAKDRIMFSHDEWNILCDGLNILALEAKQHGLKLCYHPHMGTGVQTLEDTQYLMEHVDNNVYLLVDTGHMYFANQVECLVTHQNLDSNVSTEYGVTKVQSEIDNIIDMFSKRIAHVHLKDIRLDILKKVVKEEWSFGMAVRNGVFTVPGDGVFNYDRLFLELEKIQYSGWLLVEAEQDPAKANPFEYALKARNFIKEKIGV